MSGFPTRIARSSFGPTLKDKWPIVDPTHDIGADAFNLAFHQIAGMNAVTARGLMYVTVSESGLTARTTYQGFAWDPNGSMSKINWTYSSAGIYQFSLPETQYEDEAGNLVTVELVGGMVVPQSLYSGAVVFGQYQKNGVRSGIAHIYCPQLNAKKDTDFICVLW